jgi:hypothetical protein
MDLRVIKGRECSKLQNEGVCNIYISSIIALRSKKIQIRQVCRTNRGNKTYTYNFVGKYGRELGRGKAGRAISTLK